MNMQPDYSKTRLQYLIDSNVIMSELVKKYFDKGIKLTFICKDCYDFHVININCNRNICRSIQCQKCHSKDYASIVLLLEHQHRAILRELGWMVEAWEKPIYESNETNFSIRLWLHPMGERVKSFEASTLEQCYDQAVVYALKEKGQEK